MSDRPAIPIDIIRKIMIEAGHRCAACGTPCPLEKAHIIPWSKSKDHSAENLICLCPNCHERADNEPWDQKTLQEYKRNPWVNRQFGNSPPENNQRRKEVQVTIDLSRADFDETEELWIRHGVASFLNIPAQQVKIVSIRDGSVIITLSLPEDAADWFLNAERSSPESIRRSLAPQRVLGVRTVTAGSAPSRNPPPWIPELNSIPIAALAAFDNASWEKFYAVLSTRIMTWVQRNFPRIVHADAEDVAIRVLEQLSEHVLRVGSTEELVGLARVMTRQLCTDNLRRAYRREPATRLRIDLTDLIDPSDESSLPIAEPVEANRSFDLAMAVSLIDRVMEGLSEPTRAILRDSLFSELETASIATKYGISKNAVRARIDKGKEQLRKAISASPEIESELKGLLKAWPYQ